MKLWLVTLIDFVQSVVSEHLQKETEMKKEMKPEDIRNAGNGLMLGAAGFAGVILLGYLGDAINIDFWMLPSVVVPFVCMPLFLLGMLGIGKRYGERVGRLAKNILIFAAVLGTIISLSGTVLMGVGEFWLLIFTGPAILLIGLTLFGVVALYKKPLPRWNILPLLAGGLYPIFFFSQSQLSILVTGERYVETVNSISTTLVFLILQFGALFMLGYILKSDVPQEIAPARTGE